MPREIIYTPDAPAPPAVKAAGLAFVSGTGPFDPKTGAEAGTTIQEQTNRCLTNISAILTAASSSLSELPVRIPGMKSRLLRSQRPDPLLKRTNWAHGITTPPGSHLAPFH